MTRSKILLPLGALALAGIIALGVIYLIEPGGRNLEGGPASGPLAAYSVGEMKGFVSFPQLEAPDPVSFRNAAGEELGLDAFKGKVVLLNLWATWCGPCRHEMPALDRLQADLGGPDFEVVALSLDKGGMEGPKAFYEEVGVRNLALYQDPSARAGVTLGAFGLPLTMLLDKQGRVVGRLVGAAEWDSPDAKALIKAVLERE
ncbi:redoxin [Tepidicaulis marinus]|uniref:Redoxin n=1 Tax=Tepidicaulis marinus TaxID=1333998 RepID=A0A081B8T4_9HYPH|nr:redoxin [Tepidicaulis marinus]